MSVDYEQQLLDNEAEKKTAIDNSNAAYDKTISDYQAEVNKQQQQLEDYKAEQSRFQQEQTDFAIDKIEQQQEQAEKDYTKEQQAAYGDYKKQTDPYGVNAEQIAALGLSRSGYSESSNVAMYTAYQNRVAAARASMEQAKLTFDNAIREAKLTNDINLAKIAQETLEKSLALSMESVIYLGNLELEKAAAARSIEQIYYDRAQDIREAQQESMFSITGDEGDADFSAIDAFFGDGVSDEVVAEMIEQGIITAQTVNGVTVYTVADKEKAKAYLPQTEQPQTEQPKYTDEYTLLVEEYERLRDAYLSAKRTYEAVTKWGPSPEHKAALAAAEKAYRDYPVKINPDYEPQKRKVEEARAALQVAESKEPRKVRDIQKAKEKLEEELAIFNEMKPYTITRRGNSSNGGSIGMTHSNNSNQISLR